jgi:hypothetical protein
MVTSLSLAEARRLALTARARLTTWFRFPVWGHTTAPHSMT